MLSPALLLADSTPAERAAAEVLFQEARQLSKQGKDTEACPKYEESNRIDPSIGTQLYLADCYERIGKLASAWVLFKEAASQAQLAGQSAREKSATTRADDLEARLPKLLLRVTAADTPGLELRQDGKPVRRALWGSALPVDSGLHTLQATAPGRRGWESSIQASNGQLTTVNIPELPPETTPLVAPSAPGKAPAASTTSPTSPPSSPPKANAPVAEGWSTQKTIGAISAGVGAVSLAAGTYFAFQARSQWKDAQPLCPDNQCSPQGYDLGTAAHRDGNVATVLLAIGAAGLGAGAYLWFTDKGPAGTTVGVAPGAVVARGVW